jgi:PAS domain S-box-containing protein
LETSPGTNEELLAKNRSLEEENDRLRQLLRQKDQYIETQIERRSHVFDVILSNLPDLICTFDLQGCFTYANRALLGVWQKSLAEIIGKNTFDLGYPPALAARIQSEVGVVISSGRAVINHTPFTGANGETRVYEYIFSPVFAADRSVEEVTCTARDITERERMERALAESEQKLQKVFAQAPIAIVVFRGRDFVIELANPFYQALVQGKELVGRRFADVVPELGQDVWDILHRVVDTGEPHVAHEWYIPYDQNGDGVIEDTWFNVVYHPMREAGTVSGMVAVCSDVSVQVRARKELEAANRRLEEFAYVASHDLQEPLRMVGIYTQLLLRRMGTADPEAEKFAAFVRHGVNRMQQLISDLLVYSRIIHGDEPGSGNADLNESVAQAVKTMEGRISEAKAKVRVEPLPVVCGDTSQFAQVFQNLLSNSLKYVRPEVPPEIDVSAQREGANWVISFRDNGIGFEPRFAQQIFGLFKRLHKDEYSGTGLGLAICQRIVERYRGRIWAEGRPEDGATIYFSLPVL